jgi:hypothetical protein
VTSVFVPAGYSMFVGLLVPSEFVDDSSASAFTGLLEAWVMDPETDSEADRCEPEDIGLCSVRGPF